MTHVETMTSQAMTAVQGVGGAIVGAAGSVGCGVGGLFKRKKQD